jgi:hypothetical protein
VGSKNRACSRRTARIVRRVLTPVIRSILAPQEQHHWRLFLPQGCTRHDRAAILTERPSEGFRQTLQRGRLSRIML